jgi:hypothetical protein
MNNKNTIEIFDSAINYTKEQTAKFYGYKNILTFILSIIFIILSTIIFILQIYEWNPIVQLNTFKRIKNNIGNWRKLIIDKTSIEIKRGQLQSLRLKIDAFDFQCYDYENFYSAIKLNNSNYLPEFIMRGNGDVWMFKKAANIDLSAQQFCKYIIYKNQKEDNITCGTEMFDARGYSGWFEYNHPCNNALNLIISKNE